MCDCFPQELHPTHSAIADVRRLQSAGTSLLVNFYNILFQTLSNILVAIPYVRHCIRLVTPLEYSLYPLKDSKLTLI